MTDSFSSYSVLYYRQLSTMVVVETPARRGNTTRTNALTLAHIRLITASKMISNIAYSDSDRGRREEDNGVSLYPDDDDDDVDELLDAILEMEIEDFLAWECRRGNLSERAIRYMRRLVYRAKPTPSKDELDDDLDALLGMDLDAYLEREARLNNLSERTLRYMRRLLHRPQHQRGLSNGMAKILCITGFSDAPVHPKKAILLRSFLEAVSSAVAGLILHASKRVLVVCNHGQNRSAAVCCQALVALVKDIQTFDAAKQYVLRRAHSHNTKSSSPAVPTKFLSSEGGKYFQMILNTGRDQGGRPRRCEESQINHELNGETTGIGFSYTEEPFKLELTKHGTAGLWIGNYKALLLQKTDEFDFVLNLSGKGRSNADHVLKWEDCTDDTQIMSLVSADET